jgi:7,8-dihydropterin-6-yl-methyl-4-(beta-D-ribofuranosyl)aminobenzene 5'-phosphate synthase
MSVKVTMLVENTAGRRGILGEHGLSYWIETPDFKLLFDTGQGLAIRHNADLLDINLGQADALALSHGHYDHSGGVPQILSQARIGMPLYMHPDALAEKWGIAAPGRGRPVGMPEACLAAIEGRSSDVVFTREPVEVGSGLFLTGEVPRETTFEKPTQKFFLDEAGTTPDELLDDQSMFFKAEAGVIVLLGCAHSGVVNTLRYIAKLCETSTIFGVIGGTHLIGKDEERRKQTIEAFQELELQWIAPGHCTGMAQRAAIWNAFPGKCVECSAGTIFEFERQ